MNLEKTKIGDLPPAQREVAERLLNRSHTVTELSQLCGKSRSAISRILVILKKKNLASNPERGRWIHDPRVHKTSNSKSQEFNPLQAGIAISAYISQLEKDNAELKECLESRDELQEQVYKLQSKLNEYKLNEGQKISIPVGRSGYAKL